MPGLPAPNGRFRRTRWTDDPLTKGSYVAFAPGQLTRFASLFAIEEDGQPAASRRPARSSSPANIFRTPLPAYMNGALQTGRIAAQALLGQSARRAAA